MIDFFWENFIKDPQSFIRFEILFINLKNSQFNSLNFQLLLIWTHPSILVVKN
jgi:hypothetical protein